MEGENAKPDGEAVGAYDGAYEYSKTAPLLALVARYSTIQRKPLRRQYSATVVGVNVLGNEISAMKYMNKNKPLSMCVE